MEYLHPSVSSGFKLPVTGRILTYTESRAHRNLFVTLYPRSERGALDVVHVEREGRARVTSGTVELTTFPPQFAC